MKRIFPTAAAVLAAASLAAPARAQDDAARGCRELPGSFMTVRCYVTAQALESLYPQVGILAAGGNPTPGTASTGGIRLGFLPGVSASARVTGATLRAPDVLGVNADPADERSPFGAAVSLDVSAGIFPGVALAPTVGGFGSVDLLGSVGAAPIAGDGFDGAALSWGAGARVGILRESFTLPAVSVSLMYRRVGQLEYGDLCAGGTIGPGGGCESPNPEADPGELRFGVESISTRGVVSKRLLGFGLSAGVGYDRYALTTSSFRYREGTVGGATEVGITDADSDQWRLSVFGGLSYALLIGSISIEAGWMQGGDAIPEYEALRDAQDFEHDPGKGTVFGSISARLSL